MEISQDEVALYDRQIRLWGLEAQSRMRNAHILLIGMQGLACEIAKNLVLAGIGQLTILEHESVRAEDLRAHFFITEEDVGTNRALASLPRLQQLNPRVGIHAVCASVDTKGASFFAKFDVTVVTNQPYPVLSSVNKACRTYGRAFYAASTFGLHGYVFADLVRHEYAIQRMKGNMPTTTGKDSATREIHSVAARRDGAAVTEILQCTETYVPIHETLHRPLTALRKKERRRVPQLLPALHALWQWEDTSTKQVERDDLAERAMRVAEGLDIHTSVVSPAFIDAMVGSIGREISPVVAIVGGVLAQDVLNVISQKEQPLQNYFFYAGDSGEGSIVYV